MNAPDDNSFEWVLEGDEPIKKVGEVETKWRPQPPKAPAQTPAVPLNLFRWVWKEYSINMIALAVVAFVVGVPFFFSPSELATARTIFAAFSGISVVGFLIDYYQYRIIISDYNARLARIQEKFARDQHLYRAAIAAYKQTEKDKK